MNPKMLLIREIAEVVWTKSALDDLESVAAYIARDSPRCASATVRKSLTAARSLQRFGERGHMVPALQ
jgi:plasmid stabilization system protein ParE